MFDRLKKVFGASAPPAAKASPSAAAPSRGPIADWAASHDMAYAASADGHGFVMTGKVAGKPWKYERARSSRDYIRGEEIRARADLKLDDEISVLVMNRVLKESLEKRAYHMYTDTLQTTADPNLPEEMRWLSLYQEVAWNRPEVAFWDHFSVMADNHEHAGKWLTDDLVSLLMDWPAPGQDPQTPFILMLMRGKIYLRMQYTPADLPTLDHAALVFVTASELAISELSTDISL